MGWGVGMGLDGSGVAVSGPWEWNACPTARECGVLVWMTACRAVWVWNGRCSYQVSASEAVQ